MVGQIKRFVKGLRCGEDFWVQEIEQGIELMQIVLHWRACQQEDVLVPANHHNIVNWICTVGYLACSINSQVSSPLPLISKHEIHGVCLRMPDH